MRSGFREADDHRRLHNSLCLGVIAEIDAATGRARVEIEPGLVTDFLPMPTGRSGRVRAWSPLSVGEQVLVAAPGGELGAGVIVNTYARDAFPHPSASADELRVETEDGYSEVYDFASGERTITLPEGGAWTVVVGSAQISISDEGIQLSAGGAVLTIAEGKLNLVGEVNLGGTGGKPVGRHDDVIAGGKVVATSTTVRAV